MAKDSAPALTSAALFDFTTGQSADSHQNAVMKAVAWLSDRHRKGYENALLGWVNDLREGFDPSDGLQNLDNDAQQSLAVNSQEWLLARGKIFVKGEMRNINAHLLGRDGPWFSPAQQSWIAQLSQRGLRLWRVTEVRVNQGLMLVDAVDNSAAPVWVQERSGSRTATVGLLLGARVMDLGDHFELSGATYAFARLREGAVLGSVAAAAESGLHVDNIRDLIEQQIARNWLAQWFTPVPIPEMRDLSTGDPLLLVTDHYQVLDASALAQVLQAESDVSGNAERGWTRDAPVGSDGLHRSLVSINPGKRADRIEVFARTQALADSGRTWFETVAQGVVKHLKRELSDPRGAATAGQNKPGKTRHKKEQAPAIPPEQMTALFEQMLHRIYATWADDNIPVLNGLTPRQAMVTPAGLERVKGLLREYEANEMGMAAEQGRAAVSLQFMWDALNLSR